VCWHAVRCAVIVFFFLQASEPGTIRGDYCIEVGRNVIHGSDSVENANKEIALWFGGESHGLRSLRPAAEHWLVGAVFARSKVFGHHVLLWLPSHSLWMRGKLLVDAGQAYCCQELIRQGVLPNHSNGLGIRMCDSGLSVGLHG
jgi:hypothetical protein